MLSVCPVICLVFLESLTSLSLIFVVESVRWGSDGAVPGQELGVYSVLFLGVGPVIQPAPDLVGKTTSLPLTVFWA